MNKLDKIHKKDPKAIKDRDVAIRNQFAENVRGPWLRRDLKKRIRAILMSNLSTLLIDQSSLLT
jgi:BMFP domain-containing protein YqiC